MTDILWAHSEPVSSNETHSHQSSGDWLGLHWPESSSSVHAQAGLGSGAGHLRTLFLAFFLRVIIVHGFYQDLLFQGTESGKETSIPTWQMK